MPDTTPTPAPPASAADLTGRQLGDYRLLRRLGQGGMAEVYLAEQCSLRRQVAFKVLKADLATDESYVRRFHLEAQAAASFVHANVVQIHEVGCIDSIHFIAQEYVQGQNLRELLARQGPPELKSALAILRQTASALHQAALRGIVHRDIKPENILLSRTGEVKVADFGLARVTRDARGVGLTQIGVTMGTPLYMSPEQVEGKPLDPRSDIYSLGVTCYHMLSGAPPFRGETALSVAVQHLNASPERLENVRPDLPAALCRIVHKMLAKDPADRYGSALDLLRELRTITAPGLDPLEADGELFDPDLAGPLPPAVTGRMEATQKLDALMKGDGRRGRPTRRIWQAAALAGAFLLGGLLAWLGRERYLLAGVDPDRTRIEKLATAAQQYYFAAEISQSEQAYRAVLDHFPADEYFVHLAERELALIYLYRDDFDAALKLFDRLAQVDGNERHLKAFGIAGQCVVLSLQGDHVRSAQRLDELAPLRENLTDRRMRQFLRHAVNKNQQQLTPQRAAEWETWLEERFSDAPP